MHPVPCVLSPQPIYPPPERSFGTDEDLLLVRNAALDPRQVQAAVHAAREGGAPVPAGCV